MDPGNTPSASSAEFDLRVARQTLNPAPALKLSPVLTGGLVFVIVLGIYALLEATAGHRWDSDVALLLVADLIFAVAIVFLLFGTGPQAESLRVDGQGLRFKFPDGHERTLLWDGPRFRLTLQGTDGARDDLSKGRPCHYIQSNRPFQTYIPPEAYRAIIDQAKTKGLSVRERRGYRPDWTLVSIGPALK